MVRAVRLGAVDICDDATTTLWIQVGAHLDVVAARQMCIDYIRQRQAVGWFDVPDPSTGEIVVVEVAP